MSFRPFAVVAAVLFGIRVAAADPLETLTYTLTPDFQHGVLKVELTWQTAGRQRSTLGVSPHWGRIEDVPALLKNLAFDGQVERDGALWHIAHRTGAAIHCEYVVDSGRRAFDDWELTHHPITTPDFFHGMGNAFLLTPQSSERIPKQYEVILRWVLPKGMKAVCSWGVGTTVGATLDTSDLRHSIYLAGKIVTQSDKSGGQRVTVAMVNRFDFDLAQFTHMTTEIIRRQCEFMQEKAFPDFVVTVVPVGPPVKAGESRLSGNGLYNSFALSLAPGSKLTDAVEHLFSHELFHFWNGRTLAAADPERLVFWFSEGLTDYYSLRILHESGYWDDETYAKWVNKHLREYAVNPAIHATNEQIDKNYWNERDTVGEVPYQRGLALGLRWHKIARNQGVRSGFDALFRALVERARAGGFKLSNDNIRQVGIETLGAWFGPEFDQFVVRADTVEIPPDALAPKLIGEFKPVHEFELGFDARPSVRDKKIRGLVKGSAAEKAGLRSGDEMTSWAIHGDPDRPVRVTVRRGGAAQEIEYLPRGKSANAVQFRPR